MSTVAVTYSSEVGGSSVISLKESFAKVNANVVDADFRKMMADIPKAEFEQLYETPQGRQKLFAHAKAAAWSFLRDIDCLALSGNSAMIDPELFNQVRQQGQNYDFSRTIAELALVHVATEIGMPILGVCGGHQVIAVHGGGSIADLNADKLDKQRFMNYDLVRINKDSMLAHIMAGTNLNQDLTIPHYETKAFGAHNQIVSTLGRGFKKTAIASDDDSIEAAENEFGAPIVTTQFHPEVGVRGLPNARFIYQQTQSERENSLKIFDYLNKAGDAYRQKKETVAAINSLKAKADTRLLKISEVAPLHQAQEGKIKLKKEETSLFKDKKILGVGLAGAVVTGILLFVFPPVGLPVAGLVGVALLGAMAVAGAVLAGRALLGLVKSGVTSLIRNSISNKMTHKKVSALRKKERAESEHLDGEEIEHSSYAKIIPKTSTPGEILRDTPQEIWVPQHRSNHDDSKTALVKKDNDSLDNTATTEIESDVEAIENVSSYFGRIK